eukprot:2141190-Prymnesium_polylepis.1
MTPSSWDKGVTNPTCCDVTSRGTLPCSSATEASAELLAVCAAQARSRVAACVALRALATLGWAAPLEGRMKLGSFRVDCRARTF